MNSSNFQEALKDPRSVPIGELDGILEAQLRVLKEMKQEEDSLPKSKKEKTPKGKRLRVRKIRNSQYRI
jgi:hypothetical protein